MSKQFASAFTVHFWGGRRHLQAFCPIESSNESTKIQKAIGSRFLVSTVGLQNFGAA